MNTVEVQSTRFSINQFCSETRAFFGKIALNSTFNKVVKAISDADFIGKVCKLTYKSINLHNCINERNHHTNVVSGLKGVCSALDFLETYDNMIFWIHPFSKKTVDETLITRTLQTSLTAYEAGQPEGERRTAEQVSEVVNQIVQSVFQKDILSNADMVRVYLTHALAEHGYDFAAATTIAGGVTIDKKNRKFMSCLISSCFTVANLVDNVSTLKKYNILDYTILTSKLAAVMGESKIFAFFYELGPGTIISTLSGVGLFLVIGTTTHSLIVKIIAIINAENDEDRVALKREIFALSRKLVIVSLDFVICVAPLVCTVNPTLLLALSITSKSLGIINTFLK